MDAENGPGEGLENIYVLLMIEHRLLLRQPIIRLARLPTQYCDRSG
jgi:hypothetical protein